MIWIGLPLLGLMAAVRASAWLGVGAATMVVLLFAVLVIPLGMSAWAELVGPALSYHRLRADQLGVALDVLHCSRALVPSELPERAGRGGWRVSWEQVAEVDRQKGRVVVRTHEGEIHQLPVVPYELSEQLIRSLMHVVRARRSAAEPEAAAAARQEALRQLIAAAS
ncbi:MAG: hypothetical protein KTR31_01695 [Myxococcales bacterium]|nr:hypothetical protein [Myxococcales bacterium]